MVGQLVDLREYWWVAMMVEMKVGLKEWKLAVSLAESMADQKVGKMVVY
jgi:hypothetical protein